MFTCSLRITEAQAEQLKALAEADGRSFNNYLTRVLEEHLRSQKGRARTLLARSS